MQLVECFGNLYLRKNHASSRGGICAMQQADAPGPARGPSGACFKPAECITGPVATALCESQSTYNDADDTGECPEDSERL